MSLPILLDQIKKSLSTRRSASVYAEARGRYGALAPYETVGALLNACAHGSSLHPIERDAVFSAVVTEFQTSSESFWRSVLLAAFSPLLMRLRAKLRPRSCDETDQSLLAAFLEAARSPFCRTYVARNLRLRTQERIYTERRREHRAPTFLELDEETYAGDPFKTLAYEQARAAEVLRIIEAEGGEELRELLLTTYGDDESVRAFVERTYPQATSQARDRVCKRLERARAKVLAKVRGRKERRPHESILAA